MKSTTLLEAVIAAIPYANQITDIALEDEDVRFNWRGGRYRVSGNGSVEEVKDGLLRGSDAAILVERLIKVKAFSA